MYVPYSHWPMPDARMDQDANMNTITVKKATVEESKTAVGPNQVTTNNLISPQTARIADLMLKSPSVQKKGFVSTKVKNSGDRDIQHGYGREYR